MLFLLSGHRAAQYCECLTRDVFGWHVVLLACAAVGLVDCEVKLVF